MNFTKLVLTIFLTVPFFLLADFEPDNKSFVATKGMMDPAPVNSSEINGKNSILQIRTHIISGEITLKKISVQAEINKNPVYFCSGVKSMSLYLDGDENGDSEGDKLIKTVKFSEKSLIAELSDLDIKYEEGETKHLLIDLELEMKDQQTVVISIPENGIELSDTEIEVLGLPIRSKESTYLCSEDSACTENNDNSNCRNSTIDDGELCDSNIKSCVEINPDKYTSGNAFCDYDCKSWDNIACEIDENYNPDNVDVDGCSLTVL